MRLATILAAILQWATIRHWAWNCINVQGPSRIGSVAEGVHSRLHNRVKFGDRFGSQLLTVIARSDASHERRWGFLLRANIGPLHYCRDLGIIDAHVKLAGN